MILDLSRDLLSEEILGLRREGWSGVLAVTESGVTKGLYFLEGEIAFAASTLEEDRLGANLVRIGLISRGQFEAAMRAAQEPGRRLGQALIDEGVLNPEQLAAAVTGQVERIVFSVFRWTGGRARRDPLEQPIPADLALDLNTPRLLLQGVRSFPDAERLAAALGAEDRRFRRAARAPFDYDRLSVSAAERAILARCTREASLGDVLRLPFPRAFLVRGTYALLVGGMLDDVAPARASVPRPAAAPAPPVAPRTPTPAPPRAFEAEPTAPPAWAAGPNRSLPQPPEEAAREARLLLERGQRDRAIEILSLALQRRPDAHECRRLLVLARAQEPGFLPEVEKHFLTALEADAKDVELRYRLAGYYRRAGMAAKALLQLRLVVEADPSHAAAWRDLGELEAGEGRRR